MESENQTYPVPKDINAINLEDNFKFDKNLFLINEKYRVPYFQSLTIVEIYWLHIDPRRFA